VDAVVTLDEVRTVETRRGAVRYVARDADGNEYTTFREDIGERALQLQGQRVRLEYHEERRGRYTNVYLDKIEPAPAPAAGAGQAAASQTAASEADSDEAAWQTAVAAAPWLVGEPRSAVAPDKLYEQLKPFEERVAADIEEHRRERDGGEGRRDGHS
jgi:hypothetical protein